MRSRASLLAAVAGLALAVAGVLPAGAVSDRARMPELTFAGESTLPAGMTFEGTVVGGLSSLAYDEARDVYYAISDARPEIGQGAHRFYTLDIDVSDGSLDPGDVTVVDVTTLLRANGTPFPDGSLDPEGLTLTAQDTLVLTSEGFATTGVPPRVLEFALDGRLLAEVELPAYVEPMPGAGVQQNLGIESAAVTRNGRDLFTGFENALAQDGPAATLTNGSRARIQRFNARTGAVEREYVYVTDPVAEAPVPAGSFTVNGLVELLPLNSRFLVTMERSFSVGAGNTVRLYRTALPGATDVLGTADLDDLSRLRTADKALLFDLDVLGLMLDNLEGMTLGPRLPDGGRALILVSDNNFTPGQVSQFLLFSARKVGGR